MLILREGNTVVTIGLSRRNIALLLEGQPDPLRRRRGGPAGRDLPHPGG
jgi:hypothetical protein